MIWQISSCNYQVVYPSVCYEYLYMNIHLCIILYLCFTAGGSTLYTHLLVMSWADVACITSFKVSPTAAEIYFDRSFLSETCGWPCIQSLCELKTPAAYTAWFFSHVSVDLLLGPRLVSWAQWQSSTDKTWTEAGGTDSQAATAKHPVTCGRLEVQL